LQPALSHAQSPDAFVAKVPCTSTAASVWSPTSRISRPNNWSELDVYRRGMQRPQSDARLLPRRSMGLRNAKRRLADLFALRSMGWTVVLSNIGSRNLFVSFGGSDALWRSAVGSHGTAQNTIGHEPVLSWGTRLGGHLALTTGMSPASESLTAYVRATMS